MGLGSNTTYSPCSNQILVDSFLSRCFFIFCMSLGSFPESFFIIFTSFTGELVHRALHIVLPEWNFHIYPCIVFAAAKSLQSCPTLCNPIDGSPPGSPSLGFSRQEHWSGLPFPSPMHESEKWKWSRSVMSDPQRPHGLQPSRLLHPWDFPGKSTGVGCHCWAIPNKFQTSGKIPNYFSMHLH